MVESKKSGLNHLPGSTEVPVALKLRLEKCPKCGYERGDTDGGYASPYECPRCGVVYALAMEEVRRRNKGQQLQDEAEVHQRRVDADRGPEIRAGQTGGVMYVGRRRYPSWLCVALGVGILALLGFIFY